ncbi:MAG: ChuX/HutX family heme-like substrate-binding protein [Pseudomonadota bacterium]
MDTPSTDAKDQTANSEAIRRARSDNPKMRERDLAKHLGISEAEYVAAWCGISATRIEPKANLVLERMESLGEVMALTRNESAVHEKTGVYDKVYTSRKGAIVLGEDIDLRILDDNWAHGFAVEKNADDGLARSLQFFDHHGDAVHKIHLRPKSNVAAYEDLVSSLKSDDQNCAVAVQPLEAQTASSIRIDDAELAELRHEWVSMNNVHQFMGILKKFGLTRHQAISAIDNELAWRLDDSALTSMLNVAAGEEIPIMCFVGSRGVIQIHTGPIKHIKTMGPWINIMDPGFHLHLRLDHIAELWAVRKPNRDGHVTSMEAYDANHKLIIQFFGQRREGDDERGDWRLLIENLPKMTSFTAVKGEGRSVTSGVST